MNNLREGKVRFFPIFSIATFIAISGISEVLIDETVIGNLLDDVAFGAFNVLEPYQWVVALLCYLFTVGATALIVRALGGGDKERASRVFSHAITSCLGIGFLLCLAYALFGSQMASLVARDSELLDYSLIVLEVQKYTVIVVPLEVFLASCVLYLGGVVWSGLGTVIYMVSNISLSVLLGKRMGIFGIAFATLIANVIVICFYLMYFIKKDNRLRFRPCFDFSLAKKIFGMGMGESTFFIAVILSQATINAVALKNFGAQGVAAISIPLDLFFAVAIVSEGISEYEAVSLNTYIGQKNQSRFDYSIRKTVLAALIEGAVFTLICLFAAPAFPDLFGIDSPETVDIVTDCIRVVAIAPIFVCFVRIISVFYQYTGRIWRSAFGFMFSIGIFPAVFNYILGPVSLPLGALGIAFGPVVALFLLVIYVRFIKKEKLLQLSLKEIERRG